MQIEQSFLKTVYSPSFSTVQSINSLKNYIENRLKITETKKIIIICHKNCLTEKNLCFFIALPRLIIILCYFEFIFSNDKLYKRFDKRWDKYNWRSFEVVQNDDKKVLTKKTNLIKEFFLLLKDEICNEMALFRIAFLGSVLRSSNCTSSENNN